jgi:cyclopropane-fatty-acyl-phospholipid synthase
MKVIESLLEGIERGRLDLLLSDGSTHSFGKEYESLQSERILVNDYEFFTRIAFHGDIGLGESYMDGLWDSDDLTGVLKLLIENRKAISEGNLALSAISRSRNYRLHLTRPNTVAGSKENIAAHYDLSADFYATFLDKTMTYSCGIFRSEDESLENAQYNKNRRIIKRPGSQKKIMS